MISLFKDYIPIGSRDIYIHRFWNVTSSFLQSWVCSQILVFLAVFISLFFLAVFMSCKYLRSETHPRNAQVNKAYSSNKRIVKIRIVKICLVVDMVRKNWRRIIVISCGLHYFISARFGSFWVFANFSTVERFKYLFSIAMKIQIMAGMVKKRNKFIFSSLAT